MKRIFYPSVTMLFVFISMSGLQTQAQTYTINFPSAPPWEGHANNNRNDGQDVEVGVKFRVTQIGEITAIRFYKGDSHTGTHIGHLWTNGDGTPDGTLLSSATFSETANGWQEVSFPSPITVTPGNVYVASVFSDEGWYAAEEAYWSGGTDYGSNPIKVTATLNDPEGVGNGVYTYTTSPTGEFPDQTFNASNYWIDVRFDPTFTLPVVLTDFKAATNNSDVLVSWKTETEDNSRGFEIQRSNNGSDWYPVTFVKSAGGGNVTRSYSFTDKSLAPGLYYYRLKQIDFDGKATFSSIATATIAGKGKTLLFQNYPNPFRGNSTIRFDLPTTQMVKLSIVDMAGREVKLLVNKLGQAGSHQVTIDAAALQKQIYLVRLQTETGVLTKTILVQ